MNPRSPPTRPHIGVYSSHFSTNQEWGEDDAWDSASDGDEPRQSTLGSSISRSNPSSTISAPKKIPKPSSNSSSSTLAFSYTHVSAPNPSSYSPKTEIVPPPEPSRNGWTMVQKTSSGSDSRSQSYSHEVSVVEKDLDVEGDMVVGELEPDPGATDGSAGVGAGTRNRGQSTSKTDHRVGFVRQDVEAIVTDPLNGIKNRARRDPSPLPAPKAKDNKPIKGSASPENAEKLLRERSIRSNRRQKFIECLSNTDVNIAELRKIGWAGIPYDLRPMAWQLLLGYLPLPKTLRSVTLARKRGEYQDMVDLAFARGREGLDQQIWHQIEIDVPRTRPGVRLWMYETTQRCLERILYVWAIRHPASGYVQGINDLATPFFQVFLSAYIDSDPEELDPSVLPPTVLQAVEADSFWCLSRLLDGIQDNYIFAQPGIQRSVRRMAELVARIDAPLAAHLESEGVEFMQFAFRWMNCLLMREISVRNTIRMWDTYLAEGADAFSQFHLYVCSAFLVKWSEKLRKMDFQGIIMFLQSLPTQDWGDHEIEILLSEAFLLNSIWHNAQSHFNGK